MKIYIDFDDVICETAKYFTKIAKDMFGIDVPYKEVQFFNLQKSFHLTEMQYDELMRAGHIPENLLAYEETYGASTTINKWVDEGHDVFVITGRPFDAYEPSRQWLDIHGLERVPLLCVDKYGRESFNTECTYNLTLDKLYAMDFDFAIEDSPAAFEHVLHFDNCSYSIDANCLPLIERWYHDKIYIYDYNIVNTEEEVPTLLQTIDIAIRQYDCRFLIIDNLMTAMIDDLESDQYRQQTKFVNGLVNMAKKYNVIILLIAHPRKHQGTLFNNDDVAGTANITNLADVVLRYNRSDKPEEKMTSERVLTVLKNRLTGKLCTNGIKLYFDEASRRISDKPGKFDWELGWEQHLNEEGEDADEELPFF